MYDIIIRKVYLLLGIIIVVFILKELIRYFLSTWITFCVFYTMSDLYKKRRVIIKYTKFITKYGQFYFPEYMKPIEKRKYTKVQKSLTM
jgi:hypothetical protein